MGEYSPCDSGLLPTKTVVIMDLKMVYNMLHDMREKWYELGLKLSLSEDRLDTISSQNSTDSGDCLRAMLKYWMRNRPHTATIEVLLEALSSDSVGESELAEKTRHLNITLASQREGKKEYYFVIKCDEYYLEQMKCQRLQLVHPETTVVS